MNMTNYQIEAFKEKLTAEKNKLEAEIKADNKPPDFGIDHNDIEDRSPETEAFNDKLAEASDLGVRLQEIDAALVRIENGSYGKCEKCGNDIEEEILSAVPESALCKHCKTTV